MFKLLHLFPIRHVFHSRDTTLSSSVFHKKPFAGGVYVRKCDLLQSFQSNLHLNPGVAKMVFFNVFPSFFSGWLQRLCWLKAMAHWLASGEKSRNAAQVSPPGIHCQGQKVRIEATSMSRSSI